MREITEPKDFQGKLIWIADDSALGSRLHAQLFETVGAATERFTDPYRLADKLKAITHGDNNNHLPNLILTDWTFSPTPTRKGAYWNEKEADLEGGGQVVINAVKKSGEKIPVVIYTGDARLEEYGTFPGADVSVVLKGDPEAMMSHVYARLFGDTRGRSL